MDFAVLVTGPSLMRCCHRRVWHGRCSTCFRIWVKSLAVRNGFILKIQIESRDTVPFTLGLPDWEGGWGICWRKKNSWVCPLVQVLSARGCNYDKKSGFHSPLFAQESELDRFSPKKLALKLVAHNWPNIHPVTICLIAPTVHASLTTSLPTLAH